MKLQKKNRKTQSRTSVKRPNEPGIRLRTGIKAGAGSMVHDDVLWNRPPENGRPLP